MINVFWMNKYRRVTSYVDIKFYDQCIRPKSCIVKSIFRNPFRNLTEIVELISRKMIKSLHFFFFTSFSLPSSINCLYLHLVLSKGLAWAKWEMTYSKQIQNSQIFFHVGRYCHFFGWAPRKRLISFRDQWKYIFIWRLLSLSPPC